VRWWCRSRCKGADVEVQMSMCKGAEVLSKCRGSAEVVTQVIVQEQMQRFWRRLRRVLSAE